jgi:hypothetical protein
MAIHVVAESPAVDTGAGEVASE